MKKLSRQSFEEIKLWIYRNARPLELALWQYYFEDGSKEAVLSVLSHYQNEDGGFGNALDPDSWNPNSSPYMTLRAIHILNDIEFTDRNHPMMQGILKFLASGVHSDQNGWLFSIPSNDDFPHAPWWSYDEAANQYESIGVSAGLAGFILNFADKDSPLYSKALSIANRLMSERKDQQNYGEMGVAEYGALKDTLLQLGLTEKLDISFITGNVKKLVKDAIERNPLNWAVYGKRPSDFITSPESEFYQGNEEILHKELDYIIETRPKNNVWGITWSWFENNEKYRKEFAITENWWKAHKAVEKLTLLRRFDRFE